MWFKRPENQSQILKWKIRSVREWKCSENINSPSGVQYRIFYSHFTKVTRKCECFSRIVEPCKFVFLTIFLQWSYKLWFITYKHEFLPSSHHSHLFSFLKIYIKIHIWSHVLYRVSDCCLTPNNRYFSYIMARISYIPWDDNDDVHFLLDQHA